MKLSPAQKEIVRHMQNGHDIYTTIHSNPDRVKAWGTFGNSIRYSTFRKMNRLGLFKIKYTNPLYIAHELTELGKQIKL